MNAITSTQNLITCETTEEHSHAVPSTSVITPSQGDLGTNVPIQGVSGAVYAPMDTTPKQENQQLTQLFKQLQDTITAIIQLSTTSQQTQPDLKDTIETTLQQANWFYDMVGEHIDENHDIEGLVDNQVDHRIGDAVDTWFSYNFAIDDHCDLNELVCDALDDKLEDIVTEKLEQLLEEKLANATITVKL